MDSLAMVLLMRLLDLVWKNRLLLKLSIYLLLGGPGTEEIYRTKKKRYAYRKTIYIVSSGKQLFVRIFNIFSEISIKYALHIYVYIDIYV